MGSVFRSKSKTEQRNAENKVEKRERSDRYLL
jgi:hypothetical protein